jgi:hypothetical protein
MTRPIHYGDGWVPCKRTRMMQRWISSTVCYELADKCHLGVPGHDQDYFYVSAVAILQQCRRVKTARFMGSFEAANSRVEASQEAAHPGETLSTSTGHRQGLAHTNEPVVGRTHYSQD